MHGHCSPCSITLNHTYSIISYENAPAHELSANLYDIYHCCVYSEELLMMDRGTVLNIYSFVPK